LPDVSELLPHLLLGLLVVAALAAVSAELIRCLETD